MTDVEALSSWRAPKGMTAVFGHFDARPNGHYQLTMLYPAELLGRGKSEPDRDIIHGKFVELMPFEQIVEDVKFESSSPDYAGLCG